MAVVAVVPVRRFQARAIDTDRRWWLPPVILARRTRSTGAAGRCGPAYGDGGRPAWKECV
ncbi:hypothetical protein GCM10010503_53460 [Streptomyces lucensis JCM 4490]|uniref:Uncharacterized protein n=1 Tax=Streptomyces lucensis JCM 4490 TaxID=1306176 RepID=A0A918MUT3_9ACTN|nr:hypothetical protein GCM10010503_53460 [Streptomyces lucensis JCM 4490]